MSCHNQMQETVMKIDIYDVDHGGCVVFTGPAGHKQMLDCGLCSDRP